MKYAYGSLLRFIDLGLLLLMAFLAVAGLGNTFQAPLSGVQSGPGAAARSARIRVDGSGRFEVAHLPDGSEACRPESLDALGVCMRSEGYSTYVLVSVGGATVQDLIDVLDVCEVEGFSCALASGEEVEDAG